MSKVRFLPLLLDVLLKKTMKMQPAKLLQKTNSVISISQGRRMVAQRAVKINGNVVEGANEVDVQVGDILQVGSRNFTITQDFLV